MTLYYCHATGGKDNVDCHAWLSKLTIEILKMNGYSVRKCSAINGQFFGLEEGNMTAYETIKELKEYIGLYKYKSKGTVEVLENAVETIETLSTKLRTNNLHDGWIPCSERLPEKTFDELYPMSLVTIENGDVCLGVYRHDESKWYTKMQEGGTLYTTDHDVLAWMPLPEPYIPEGKHEQTASDEQWWKERLLRKFLSERF